MSLRLKLENTERGSADQRAMASELAERYGEAQRELARGKAAMQVSGSIAAATTISLQHIRTV